MNVRTVIVVSSLGAGVLLFVGCGPASQPPAQPEQTAQPAVTAPPPPMSLPVSTNAVMVSLVDHAGHGLWDAEREGRAPKTAEDWEIIAEHAIQVAATGVLITIPGTGPNDLRLTREADWQKWARAMSDAGLAAFKATEAKDLKALVSANSQLVDSVRGLPRRVQARYPERGHPPQAHACRAALNL